MLCDVWEDVSADLSTHNFSWRDLNCSVLIIMNIVNEIIGNENSITLLMMI